MEETENVKWCVFKVPQYKITLALGHADSQYSDETKLMPRPTSLLLAHRHILGFLSETITGLPRSGKKFWKMKKFPGQGKVREFHFHSGKFKKKNEKSHGKVREFQIFS